MEPVTIALLIAAGLKAIGGLGQGFMGMKGKKEGEAMLPGLRPEMTMPESTKEAVELFKTAAGRTEIPGQDIITGDIKAGTAGGIQAAQEAGGVDSLGAITQMVGKEQEAISGLGVPLAQMKLAAEGQLGAALFQKAGTEQEMEEWNKIQAWKEKYYEGQRRIEQGKEDAFAGFGSIAEAGGGIFAGLLGSQTGGFGEMSDADIYDVDVGKKDGDAGPSAWAQYQIKNWSW